MYKVTDVKETERSMDDCGSRATPPITITARAMAISASRARSSTCSTRGTEVRLFSNFAEAMNGVPDSIVERQLGLFARVDPAYGPGARAALGTSAP